MAKAAKKKPAARPASTKAEKPAAVTGGFNAGKTRPMDAGYPSANKGGKGSSASKGRWGA